METDSKPGTNMFDQSAPPAQQQRVRRLPPLVEAGFAFPPGYGETQARSLANNDAAWRAQWMLAYLYVVLLYRIIKAKKGDSHPEKLITELKNQEVPMFNGCIMLCSLGSYLRANQAMRLVDDSNAAYSYLNSFISLHGSGKGESEFDANYLRNRAGDMSLWCALGALFQNGFQPAGEPVLLTQDEALTKLILRCFPRYLDSSRKMMFTPDERVYLSRVLNHSYQTLSTKYGMSGWPPDLTLHSNKLIGPKKVVSRPTREAGNHKKRRRIILQYFAKTYF